nr:anaerobic nitric oxide reductase transcription regulator NorR [uncultured bacterium]
MNPREVPAGVALRSLLVYASGVVDRPGSAPAPGSSSMPTDLIQTTLSVCDPVSSDASGHGHAIRWVFPRPPPAPTWIEAGRVVLGRDSSADAQLPSGEVSRRHAEIARSGPLFLVSDAGSKNGVFLNGKRVTEAALSPGDVLRIGNHVGVFVAAPRGASLGLEPLPGGLFGGHVHRRIVERLRELAPTDLPVVLQGESGTGKERFARALHESSGRAGPFVAVNCAVYSRSIAPAELFGYRKGAFPGAEQESPGHVRAAAGGTLLLDEVSELPLDVQAMLLRVIENREVLPLGEARAFAVDVRFVVATQEPLATCVDRGRFRADLRARLEGTVIELPALSECAEMVPDLFLALFEKHAGVAPELTAQDAERLCLHAWPLNVRELETLVRRLAVAYRPGVPLDLAELEPVGRSPAAKDATLPSSGVQAKVASRPIPGRRSTAPYKEEEVANLIECLARHAGNVTKAASELGISRQRAYRMLEAAEGTAAAETDESNDSR